MRVRFATYESMSAYLLPMYHPHAPPYCVYQDILHEWLISHISYIYLKSIQNNKKKNTLFNFICFFFIHLYVFKNLPIMICNQFSTPFSGILLVYLITMLLKITYCLAQLCNNGLIVRKITL